MRGLVALLMALGLTACATNRTALLTTPVENPCTVQAPGGPLPAQALAQRLGLQYSDASSHVLLSDTVTRVRIWKDSNEISVGGQTVRVKDRTQRSGRSLMVPSSMVSYVEARVGEQRKMLAPPPRRMARTVRPALVLPALPPKRPAANQAVKTVTPAAAPSVPTPQAGWEPGSGARQWRWIVLHHSDDTSGDLAKYDRIHRESNGWDECGYHFVIGNGTLSGDGQIEVGSRWYKQKHGAHCKTADNCFNDYGVGICLVGDYETVGPPTQAQMEALVHLCQWLQLRFQIPLGSVVGHCDCKATACPGKYFPWPALRSSLSR